MKTKIIKPILLSSLITTMTWASYTQTRPETNVIYFTSAPNRIVVNIDDGKGMQECVTPCNILVNTRSESASVKFYKNGYKAQHEFISTMQPYHYVELQKNSTDQNPTQKPMATNQNAQDRQMNYPPVQNYNNYNQPNTAQINRGVGGNQINYPPVNGNNVQINSTPNNRPSNIQKQFQDGKYNQIQMQSTQNSINYEDAKIINPSTKKTIQNASPKQGGIQNIYIDKVKNDYPLINDNKPQTANKNPAQRVQKTPRYTPKHQEFNTNRTNSTHGFANENPNRSYNSNSANRPRVVPQNHQFTDERPYNRINPNNNGIYYQNIQNQLNKPRSSAETKRQIEHEYQEYVKRLKQNTNESLLVSK